MSYTDEQGLRWDTRQLVRRLQSMIVRGTVASVNDGTKMQEVGLDLEDGHSPSEVEHIHPYGISFKPKADAEVVAMALGGNRDNMMVLAIGDRRYRLKGLADGEFAIHDDQGQKVHLARAGVKVETPFKADIDAQGDVTVKSGGTCKIEAPEIMIKGNITVIGNITQTGGITSTEAHAAAGHV